MSISLKPSSRALVSLAVCLGLALVAGISGLAYWSLSNLARSTDWVDHTYEVLTRLESLHAATSDALTGSRGYIITGDDHYLEPFTAALPVIDGQLQAIRDLIADDPRQQQRLTALEPLIRQRVAISSAQISLRRQSGFEAARDDLQSGGTGKHVMDQIRAHIRDVEVEELALLRTRTAQARRLSRLSDSTVLLSSAVSLALLVSSSLWLLREMRRRRRAEEALNALVRRSQGRLAGIAESAMDAILSIDEGGLVLYFNQAAEKMFGVPASEALGTPHERFLPPRFHARHVEDVREFGRTGVSARSMRSPGRLVALRKSGEEFPIEATISQFEDQGQRVYTVIMRDITERIRGEEERDRLLRGEQAARAQAEATLAALQRVLAITDVALSQLGLKDLLDELADRMRQVSNVDGVLFFLITEDGREQEVRAAWGWTGAAGQVGARYPTDVGWTGRVYATRQALVVEDIDALPLPPGLARATPGRSAVLVPLLVDGQAIGVLSWISFEPRMFTREEVRLAQMAADRMAAAIRRAQLHEEEVRARQAVEAAQLHLRQATELLAASLELPAMLDVVVRSAASTLCDVAMVEIVDDRGQVRWHAVYSPDPDAARRLCRLRECIPPEFEGGRGGVLRSGKPRLLHGIKELADQPAFAGYMAAIRESQARSTLMVPLTARNRTIGVLSCQIHDPRRRLFEDRDLEEAQDLARTAALAIDHAILYQQAQGAIALRDDVLGTVSHDLRNMLSGIQMRAQYLSGLLGEGTASGAPEQLADGLARIYDSSRRMGRQLSALVDVRRQQAGQALDLVREPLDLVELVREEVREVQARAADHRIALVAEVPALRGTYDRARLGRVVTNLLSNAVKYSPDGGEIAVRVGVVPARAGEASGGARIEVRDHGIGIPAADLPHIGERFYRAANARKVGGTGLGLFGAKQIIEQHGGTLVASSAPAQGTCFTIEVPGATPGVATHADLSGRRILVVEDHADTAAMMVQALERQGARTQWANTAELARMLLEAGPPPDVLVLDVNLPDMAGTELVAGLRAAGRAVPPVLLVSAVAPDRLRQEASLIQAAGALHKPFEMEDLCAKITEIVVPQ